MKTRLLFAAVSALSILNSGTARAGIIFDSITGSANTGLLAVSTYGPEGDSFSTGASASSLTDVKFRVYNPAMSTTGSITATLYASNGQSPVTSLGSLGSFSTSAVMPGQFAIADFSSFSPINLAGSTRFFVLLSTSDGSPLDLETTTTLGGPGVYDEFNYYNGAAQTNQSVGGTFEMQVSTSPPVSAVPEPSSLVMMQLALAGSVIGFVRNRLASRSTP